MAKGLSGNTLRKIGDDDNETTKAKNGDCESPDGLSRERRKWKYGGSGQGPTTEYRLQGYTVRAKARTIDALDPWV